MLNVETIVKESTIIYQFGETLGIKTQDFKIRMPRKINPFTANYHCVHVRVCQQGAWGGGGGIRAWQNILIYQFC